MRQIFVVGVNHRSAPVEIRERLAFPQDRLAETFTHLREAIRLDECLILSTCNRMEIYGVAGEVDGTVHRLYDFLGRHSTLNRTALASSLYVHRQPESVHHLFRVTSGLDSMILGESEITGQVKEAYRHACEHGATGKVFNVLFQKAFNAAKDVRSRTELGRGTVSVGSVAAELARKIFGLLHDRRILLLGAGGTGELVLKCLRDRGARHVVIANRSLEHAAHLAEQYQGRATSLARSRDELEEADIAVAATGAGVYLLAAADAESLMKRRRSRPLFLIDLSVPRNIDPLVSRLENVYLYNIDDLQGVAAGHRTVRESAVTQSHTIIQQKAQRFMEWLTTDGTDAVQVYRGDARERVSDAAS